MLIFSGIDEAGLGPILGPFCAAAVSFKAPSDIKEILKDTSKKILYVDDSKKVYQGKYGFNRLEANVLAFYTLLNGEIPESINSFIPSLNSPWNRSVDMPLPICVPKEEIMIKRDKIGTLLKENGIELLDIKRTAIPANSFNKLLDLWENKSIACQKIINPLLINALKLGNKQRIIIDKQGGRKFYKEYLDQLLGIDNTAIIKEENNHSAYRVDGTDIEFMAKADSNNFTVALASMFSKYMRELAMLSFNRYWEARVPGIKKTAGYYTDRRRCIDELESAKLMPNQRDSILRKK